MSRRRMVVLDRADAQDLDLIVAETFQLAAEPLQLVPLTNSEHPLKKGRVDAIRAYLSERFHQLDLGGDNSVTLRLNDHNRRGADSFGLKSVSVAVQNAKTGASARLKGEYSDPTIGFVVPNMSLQIPDDGKHGLETAIAGFCVAKGFVETIRVLDGQFSLDSVEKQDLYVGTPAILGKDKVLKIFGPKFARIILDRVTPLPKEAIRECEPVFPGIYACTYERAGNGK